MVKLRPNIVEWLRQMVSSAGARGLVVGMSGGIDSALTAALAQEACPRATLGLIVPCHSQPDDERLALLTAEKFGIETRKVDIDRVYDLLMEAIGRSGEGTAAKLAEANIKPRLRMTIFYYHANLLNYLVAGTSNKSEMMLGYFTKNGDNAVDLMPIGGLLKQQVRELAREMGVPQEVIDRPPSAGLWAGQTDERELGVSYEKIDGYLRGLTSGRRCELSKRDVDLIVAYMARSNHKREKPPVFIPGSAAE